MTCLIAPVKIRARFSQRRPTLTGRCVNGGGTAQTHRRDTDVNADVYTDTRFCAISVR